ncbi:alcohol-forming fatty acyl-CoA reductase-like [Mercurialis annua]|uniref:alcohol-forming fatty acyl-CoA reductase-like n=1 Tax=Mercurialis annua TaxID=3986 RepID=UPI0021607C71|nr:alcohol-forming fatty acyl-CoA reductase-like [Mercurialis annua]
MEFGSVNEFLENKTILVTGATGYLAKIFVEKILRVQPNVKKLYLLLRARDANSAMERFNNEVIGKELFKVLRETHGANLHSFASEKMTPIPGDISCEDLGIKDSNLKDEMLKEIDVVINFAATTNFDERYDVALGINTLGALHVLNFAKKCLNIKMLVHVSTAYVCGEDTGIILEKPYLMGRAKKGIMELNIEEEKKLVQEKIGQLKSENASEKEITETLKEFGIQRAKLFGWPNTYVFTKAMGEMQLVHYKQNLPLLIIRPTMITSTRKQPFPGWIEGLRTVDSVIGGYAKGRVTCFVAGPNSILDVIPADMVVNGILVAMMSREKQISEEIIYQIGSSMRNPLKFSNIHDFIYRYFTANPLINKYGNPVKIMSKGILLGSMASFRLYMALRFQLPLKVLQLANTVVLKKYQEEYIVLDKKLKLVMKLVELYKPYVLFEGIFDDTNTEKLRMASRSEAIVEEEDEFDFDPTYIDWDDYMMNIHIPGLVKHVIK